MSELVESAMEKPKFRYLWDWGESGEVEGMEEVMLLQQRAKNLDRRISFFEVPQGPPPVDRPERVALKSKIYALEEEAKELKERATLLFGETERLRNDNRLLVIQKGQLSAQVQGLQSEIAAATTRAVEAERRAVAAEEELSFVRPLVQTEEQVNAAIEERERATLLQGTLGRIFDAQTDEELRLAVAAAKEAF